MRLIISASTALSGLGLAAVGWPIVAALAVILLSIVFIVCWILANSARTSRLTRIITATRVPPSDNDLAQARRRNNN